jgi:oligoribonuclease NrnB/cAMP/cGMP phosphodiesterase (DHH superfamily)
MLNKDEIDVVIYHSPCSDGTGSAYCAWKYFQNTNKIIEYLPRNIGALPPNNLENKNVLIVDYSYKKDILLNLISKVKNLLIIDHHKSAEKDLQDIEDKYKIFDMNHSGCILTWNYFFPDILPPLVLKYIEDTDIWTKVLPNTNEFVSWFYTLPHDFEIYDLYTDNELLLSNIESKGKAYLELNNIMVEAALQHSVPKFCKIKNKYYFVSYVNSVLKSDVGNKSLSKWPLIDFSAVYTINDKDDSSSFSLRSSNKHVDVSEVAFAFGGGGHRNASGISIDYVTNVLPSKVLGDFELYRLLDTVYFDKLGDINVVYLSTSIYRYEFCSYLLQNKYNNINMAENLYMIKNNSIYSEINCVIVYNFDKGLGKTDYSIKFNDKISGGDIGVFMMDNFGVSREDGKNIFNFVL